MALATLKEVLEKARTEKYGVGGFVSTDIPVTRSLIKVAEKRNAPLIVMIPWATTLDVYHADEYLRLTVEMARNAKVPVVVHLDHGASYQECILAINAGFSSVMYDGSSLPIEENVRNTCKVVEAAHACGISVEAEIGHVGGAEGGALIDGGMEANEAQYTTVEEAVSFADATGIDALAVAIGTVHGIYKGTPKLDLKRLAEINDAICVPLVLHGGSGLREEDYRNVIANGITKINYFTEMSMRSADAARSFAVESGTSPIHMMQVYGALLEELESHVDHVMEIFGC